MTDIKWQEPPSDGRERHGKWEPVADRLRSRPGAWALIAEGVSASLRSNLVRGNMKAFRPAGSFEAVSRNPRSGQSGARVVDIYARYVGEDVAR